MLSENIKSFRKSKGLSQEELALKLHVVRQTISKWEQVLSVPDSEMLLLISEVFETPVSTLLGESVLQPQADDLKAISEKLEVINLQLSQRKKQKRKALHLFFILLCAFLVLVCVLLIALPIPYENMDFSNPQYAIVGTSLHAFEWLFFRIAPFVFICSIIGVLFTRRTE